MSLLSGRHYYKRTLCPSSVYALDFLFCLIQSAGHKTSKRRASLYGTDEINQTIFFSELLFDVAAYEIQLVGNAPNKESNLSAV